MRRGLRPVVLLAVLGAVSLQIAPDRLEAATNPLAQPASMVRYYLHALGSGQCLLASKFGMQGGRSLSAFLRDCRTIRRVVIQQLDDSGYRLRPQTAAYTCLAIRYTIYRRSGATTYGGWYLMERTLGPSWRILFSMSHVVPGGNAIHLARTECASHLPAYVHPATGTVIAGMAFLSPATGWIAVSTSGSYAPNGSCTHGIGSNCNSAPTTMYRTGDAGRHWTPLLRFTTTVGFPVWIRLFSAQVGLVAATVGPLNPFADPRFTSVLFGTRDAGRHWQRFSLPMNYPTAAGSISFPDPWHGWLWYGGGAGGSMAVDVYRTTDGGRRWSRVACTSFPNPTPAYACPHQSGIGLGGDKEYLTFRDARNGWLTATSATGIPDIYFTADGGVTWRRQAVGLPPGVALPTGTAGKATTYPSGTLLTPAFFGSTGVLPESVGFYRSQLGTIRSRLYIFRSTDGGATWRPALTTPVTDQVALWQAIDPRHWVFLSTLPGQTLWSTADGGRSWTKRPVRLPGGRVLLGLQMIDPENGWATAQTHADAEVSALGTTLLHVTDGGVHWTEVELP